MTQLTYPALIASPLRKDPMMGVSVVLDKPCYIANRTMPLAMEAVLLLLPCIALMRGQHYTPLRPLL